MHRTKKVLSIKDFPYKSYLEFLSFFLDDVLIYTDEKLGTNLHLTALDACFYAISRAGWVTNLKKCQFLTDKIKFLGVQSGEFKWEQCHARSFSEMKLLIVKPKA